MDTQKNIKRFNLINNSISNLENTIKESQSKKKELVKEKKALLNSLLQESGDLIEISLCKWADKNPIEAMAYIIASEKDTSEIFYKNENSYKKLFGEESSSFITNEKTYKLINKKTFKSLEFSEREIQNHFSSLKNRDSMDLELEFLNNYKICIIKEAGSFNHENDWDINFYICKSEISREQILNILLKNFSVIEKDFNKYIELSKEGAEDLAKEHEFDLFYGYEDYSDVIVISNENNPVGLLDFYISSKGYIEIENIEIIDEYRKLGYASRAISTIQEIFNLPITGYSTPNDDGYNFWYCMGAVFEGCENCERYNECEGFECDKPLDYCFSIDIN